MNKLSIEEIIQEAQKAGLFDNLPGKGKPLHLDPSPDAVVNNLVKEANVKPEWIELAIEIDRLLQESERLLESYARRYVSQREALEEAYMPDTGAAASPQRLWWQILAGILTAHSRSLRSHHRHDELAQFRRDWDGALARYAALLHAANRKMRRFNYLVPVAHQQRRLIPIEERLRAFTEHFPRLMDTGDGTLQAMRGSVPPSLLTPPQDKPDAMPRDIQQVQILHTARRARRKQRPRK
ncbi:MAG: DUF1992 domain-containing protein [Armatimonadota bacterium]|nr:DUF1992 domain-containing protein [Armatimonadota bacterium]